MAWVFMLANCGCCSRPFTFNPMKVPSFAAPGEKKQPVCQDCLDAINKVRKEKGMSHAPALPGAYEPCHESEIVY